MPSVLWETPGDETRAVLTKSTGEKIVLYTGVFFKYGKRTSGVLLEGFTNKTGDVHGPCGVTYLPWREEEKRWATRSYSLWKGNMRHLVAPPAGLTTYGEHVDWDTVELVNGGVRPDADQIRSEAPKETGDS